ncbi:dephospho-CoA kinase [Candidatus Sumerlaeota bacterium]|nr:dephospho-CoA kinase [Candidatus Sumerlaeota bacterium]
MRIGLTGSFGSGKTTVSKFFEEMGAYVIDADVIAHEVTEIEREGYYAIIREYGNDFLNPDGSLNRKKLAERVFNDPKALAKLESILHPLVRKRERELLETHKDDPLVVLSVPLLLEKGMDVHVDKVAVVTINEEERYKRLIQNRGLTQEEIEQRLKNQMPQEEKIKRGDYIIDNSGAPGETREQVKALIKNLKNGNF